MAHCKLSGPVFRKAGSLSRYFSFPATALTSSYTLTPLPPLSPAFVHPTGLYVGATTACSHGDQLRNTHPLWLSPDQVAMETKLRYIINPARHHRRHGVCRSKDQSSHSVLNSGVEHCRVTLEATPTFTELWTTSKTSSKTSLSLQVGGAGHVTSSLALPSLRNGALVRGEVVSCAETSQQPVPLRQQRQEQLEQKQGQEGEDLPSPAQLSFILLKLREELPSFFTGHHTYSMYAPNLVFTNNLLPFSWSLHSRWSYQCFLAACRGLLRVRCSQLKLDLLRITKSVESGRIEARWRLRGKPRLRFKERVILDGYSEFVVNSNGVISRHKMDCMMPAQKAVERKESLFPSPLNLLPKQALPEN